MRTLIIILSLLFYYFSSYAQIGFTKGYIIKLNGDTTLGYLDYSISNSCPNNIKFKSNLKDNEIVYSPKDIKGFWTENINNIYASVPVDINPYIFDIEKSRVYHNTEDVINDIQRKKDTIFALCLVKGSINLYEYIDQNKQKYYIIEKKLMQFETLLDFKFKLLSKGRTYITHTEEYKSQLINILSNHSAITQKRINNINYKSADIHKMIYEYNQHKQVTYNLKRKKIENKLFMSIGVINELTPIDYGYGIRVQEKKSYKYSFSIGSEWYNQYYKFKKKYSIWGIEVSYNQKRTEDSLYYDYIKRTIHYESQGSLLSLRPYIGYYWGLTSALSKHKIGLTVRTAPVVLEYIINNRTHLHETTPNFEIYKDPLSDFNYSHKGFQYNFLLRLGIRINNLTIEGRYINKSPGLFISYLL